MALSPQFASTIVGGHAVLATANTARDGTGTIATVQAGGSSGAVIRELSIKATNDPADCNIVLFRFDGANTISFDEIRLGNPVAATATTPSFQYRYPMNLKLAPNHELRASITAAPTAGNVNIVVTDGQQL